MKWFKHMTDAHRDEKLTQLFTIHKHRGVCIYWWIIEIIAEQMDQGDKCDATHDARHWAKMLGTYAKDLDKITTTFNKLGLMLCTSSGNLLTISCPKLLEIRARKKPIGRKTRRTEVEVHTEVEVEPPKPPKGGVTYPEIFLKFWETYPKKVGKKAAYNAWRRCKFNGHAGEVIQAVEKQKSTSQWKKDNGKFIPNPATWLNQGRWEDEVRDFAEDDWQAKFIAMGDKET